VLMKARRHEEAILAYRESLRHRPNYAGTYLDPGFALKDAGRFDEAAMSWEQAKRLAPNHAAAEQELIALGRACDLAKSERFSSSGGGEFFLSSHLEPPNLPPILQ
jgi:tetratricopeptide (TPR) repeat protein